MHTNNIKNYIVAAKLSELAYLEPIEARKILKENFACFSHNFFYAGTSTDVYSFNKNKTPYFVFRGTEGKSEDDIRRDLSFDLVEYEVGKIHRGFKEASDETFMVILDYLSRNHSKQDEIHFAGHSLGGAIALTTAFELAHFHGYKNISLTTYGQPKIGEQILAREIEKVLGKRFFRFVNDKDLVPTLPPETKLGYVHANDSLTLREDGTLLTLKGKAPFYLSLSESLVEAVLAHFNDGDVSDVLKDNGLEFLHDHKINNYIKSLNLFFSKL